MKYEKIKTLVIFFLLMIVLGVLGRSIFFLVYKDLIGGNEIVSVLPVIWHGLPLDLAVAGYVTLVPTLIMMIAEWWNGKVMLYVWKVYQTIVVVAIVVAFIANIALYKYWGFPLDSTPLFYLLNSPGEFIACLSIWQMIFGPIGIVCLVIFFYKVVDMFAGPQDVLGRNDGCHSVKLSLGLTAIYALLVGVQIILIRGGFSVSVNNVGKVYFSSNTRLNHAAVNPVFSFVDSVTSDEDFSQKYRFMDDKEADKLFSKLSYTSLRTTGVDILTPAFRKAIEDGKTAEGDGARVVIVILESFSKYIMTDGGHVKGVTPNLDRLANEGVYFTNFYANSFRTDRGIVSILSGYPAQPTMSLMKYPHKTNNLYSIARSLSKESFVSQYIYGGDIDFTNCRSYLRNVGFANIVDEDNYDLSIDRGKWGVNDEELFIKALQEMKKDRYNDNVLRVIQTSSSHEPYEVPWHKLKSPELNAFNYTDDCIGQFVDAMKRRPDWNRTLLVFVPDHLGCYPENMDNFQLYRYQIPLIFTGGAVNGARKIDTIGSQQDIAATLLGLLGINHKEFIYSKDMLDPQAPHFAFFTVPDAMGMVDNSGAVIYDNTSNKVVLEKGKGKKELPYAKAYLQKLYDDISKR